MESRRWEVDCYLSTSSYLKSRVVPQIHFARCWYMVLTASDSSEFRTTLVAAVSVNYFLVSGALSL